MIPNGGMEMTCRRCSAGFHISLQEKTQAQSSPTNTEPTRIGVSNPYEEDSVDVDLDKKPARAEPEADTDGERDTDADREEVSGIIPKPRLPSPITAGSRAKVDDATEAQSESDLHRTQRMHPREDTKEGSMIPEVAQVEPKTATMLQGKLALSPSARTPPPPSIAVSSRTPAPPIIAPSARTPPPPVEPVDVASREPTAVSASATNGSDKHSALSPLERAAPPPTEPSKSGGRSLAPSNPLMALNPSAVSAHPSQANVYERVAHGIPMSEERAAPPIERSVRGKAWNEPSKRARPHRTGALSPARRMAEHLNRSPLAVKVALVVLPAALGLALVLISARNPQPDPVEIAVPRVVQNGEHPAVEPPAIEAPKVEPPKAEPPKAEAAKAETPKTEPPRTEPQKRGDDPATDGYAYVIVDHARLRALAETEAPLTAKLELGQLVKTFDHVGPWVLVMAVPEGPAGFISDRLLGSRKPIALLAKEIDFPGCATGDDVSRDECLARGKQAHEACLQGCGVANAPEGAGAAEEAESSPVVRCAEACRVAFMECQRACNEGEDRRAKRRPRSKHRPHG
jgi:hypothetical protein